MKTGRTGFCVVMTLALLAAPSAQAITWTGGVDDWTDGTKWNPVGPPTASDTAYINNAGTAEIGSGDAAVAYRFYLGNVLGQSGAIELSGGSLTATGSHSYVGNSGTGTFTQTDGTVTLGGMALYLGMTSTGDGTYTLSGNPLTSKLTAQYLRVGEKGTGLFDQTGGTVTITSQNLVVGRYSPANGTYNLSGTGQLSAPTEYIGCWGSGTGGTGAFNQSGGTNTVASDLHIGRSGGTGTYTLTGGTLSVGGDIIDNGTTGTSNFYIDGLESAYTLTVSGGDIKVDNFGVGHTSGSTGQFTLTSTGPAISATNEYVGQAGTGTFTQTGSTNTVANNLSIGAGGSTSVYRLTGGTLDVGGAITGGADSHFRIDGLETAYTLTVGGNITVDRFGVGYNSGSTGEFTLDSAGPALLTDWQHIGYSGTGTFTHTGMTNSVTNGTGAIYIGDRSTGIGTYNLSGTGQLTARYLRVGENGTGEFNHSSGTVTVTANNLIVGRKTGATGTYNLSGTGQLSAPTEYIGGYETNIGATGTFKQSGGTNTISSSLYIGYDGGIGTYSISDGDLDVGGTLVVGNAGTGLFHIIGDAATIDVDGYSQNSLSTLEVDINGISAINVDGTVTLAGYLDVEFLAWPGAGVEFTLIANNLDDAITGNYFIGKPEGALFMAGGDAPFLVGISYVGGTGNDVVLTTTPEPTTLALLGLGGLGVLLRRRRRARR